MESLLFVCHELVNNAVEHGNRNNPNKIINIEITIAQEKIIISIKDEGDGFDWEKMISKEIDLSNFDSRGRGIIFSKSMVDSISYNKKGNQVIITKKR